MDDWAFEKLTPAERNVMRAALGRTNDQVAEFLGISTNTVAAHILAARRKLGSPTRGDAARGFCEWESSHQKPTRPFTAIGEPLISEPRLSRPSDELREERTTFAFDLPSVRPEQSAAHQWRPYERLILVVLGATLLMACFRFLPDLVAAAQAIGNLIDPLND